MAAYNRLADNYYNEFDEKAAAWLRELIRQGHIAPGEVDTRSIVDVRPDDLIGYTQCHFFAGVGVWSYAARRADWPDDRPLWTGSPPCQPFSAAGKGLGTADERHLWPAFFHLIDVRRPDEVFGEQVASKDALAWLDHVSADLEGAGYALGAFDLCAAGFGAPHIRQRLKFVATRALADPPRSNLRPGLRHSGSPGLGGDLASDGSSSFRLGDSVSARLEGHSRHGHDAGGWPVEARSTREASGAGGMADGPCSGRGEERPDCHRGPVGDRKQGFLPGSVNGSSSERMADDDDDRLVATPLTRFHDSKHYLEPCGGAVRRPGPTNGLWGDADWLLCRDGKWRPVEPGTFPLAHGAPARVGRLRGYGNAIVAPVAEAFIRTYLEAETAGFSGERQSSKVDSVGGIGVSPADLLSL